MMSHQSKPREERNGYIIVENNDLITWEERFINAFPQLTKKTPNI